jgi:AraC-like DNA-binding protein
MERRIWATESVAERERLAFWREEVGGFLGIVADRAAQSELPFCGRATAWAGGAFRRVRYEATAHVASRGRAQIARTVWDGYWVYRESGPGAAFVHGENEFVSRSGGLAVADADLPFEMRPQSRSDHDVWLIPKARLDPYLPRLGGPVSLNMAGAGGLDALSVGFLDTVNARMDTLSDTEADHAVDILCRLVGVACGAALPEQKDAVRAARLGQIKRYVDQHLAEPGLTPARVAAALGMSVRSLHLAFEPSGTSFAEHVTRRRIQECRAALERPAAARSITDVAFAWGFANLTTFYNAFRREFGAAPGDVVKRRLTPVCAEGKSILRPG